MFGVIAMPVGVTKELRKACRIYEGCHGKGWLYDPTDSGSGAQVYCECEAGDRMKACDRATVLLDAIAEWDIELRSDNEDL